MCPRKSAGEGTSTDSGTDATQVLENRGSEVSCAMASIEPGSGVSGACAQAGAVENSHENAIVSSRRVVDFIATIRVGLKVPDGVELLADSYPDWSGESSETRFWRMG
jgi:hypothetical protein